MSKVNETGHVNRRLRPFRGFFCFRSFVTERGFRVLSSAFFDTRSHIVTQPAITRQGFHRVELRYSCWFKFFTFSTVQLCFCLLVTSFKCLNLLYPTVRVLLYTILVRMKIVGTLRI